MKRISTLMILYMLMSCTPEPQDQGDPGISVDVSGVVLHGELSNATVYVDSNNNLKIDSWEARGSTDNEGRFHITFKQHSGRPVLRVFGGYVRATGQAFHGSLAADLSNPGPVVVSPYSTLMSVMEPQEREELAAALGVTLAELGADYLDFTDARLDTHRPLLVKTALKTKTMVEIVAAVLDRHYTTFGQDPALPGESSGIVYAQLVAFLKANAMALDGVCRSGGLRAWIVQSETALRNYLTTAGGAVPATTLAAADITAMDAQGGALCAAIDASPMDAETLPRLQRAVQVVVMKMGADPRDASVTDAIAIMDPSITTYVPNLDAGFDLPKVSANISAVVASPYDNADGSAALSGAGLLAFPDLANQTFAGATLNRDWVAGDVGAVVLYFHGDTGATRGDLTLCLSYRQQDGTGSWQNTAATRFTGAWSRLDDYRVILDIDLVLFRQALLLKTIVDGSVIPGISKRNFLLNVNGNVATWESPQPVPEDFTGFVTAPGSDAECAHHLP